VRRDRVTVVGGEPHRAGTEVLDARAVLRRHRGVAPRDPEAARHVTPARELLEDDRAALVELLLEVRRVVLGRPGRESRESEKACNGGCCQALAKTPLHLRMVTRFARPGYPRFRT